MKLDELTSRQVRVTALEKLDNAVCTALANDETREDLRAALAGCTGVPAEVRSCVEAACEHFGYGERMEARMLLTVAHRLLTRVTPPVRG
jgi:hypothetical protein